MLDDPRVTTVFDDTWRKAVRTVAALFRTEQRHFEDSPYRFERPHAVQTDTLRNQGRGMPVNYTGMTWSGFRPSDDACEFGYLIPANMFAVVALRHTAEILRTVCGDVALATELETAARIWSLMPASASMNLFTVEPVPTPTMSPGTM